MGDPVSALPTISVLDNRLWGGSVLNWLGLDTHNSRGHNYIDSSTVGRGNSWPRQQRSERLTHTCIQRGVYCMRHYLADMHMYIISSLHVHVHVQCACMCISVSPKGGKGRPPPPPPPLNLSPPFSPSQ